MKDNIPLKDASLLAEGEIIEAALLQNKYHKGNTAKQLGITRRTLWGKMKAYEELRESLKEAE